jgi:hypothetical protein
MLEVLCPICSRRLKAPEDAVGQQAKCAHCFHSFTVPVTPAPPREIILELADKRPINASKVTASAACVIAICVFVLTIQQFWPRRETLEEKRVRYARVSKDVDKITRAATHIIYSRPDAPHVGTPEEQQAIRDVADKELGVAPQRFEQLKREKQTLAEELGIPD